MYPVLFTFFGFDIRASAVFLALAIVAGILVAKKEMERRNMAASPRKFTFYWVSAVLVTLLLAALNAAGFHSGLPNTVSNPKIVFADGYVSFGAILGLLGWVYILAKIERKPVEPGLDTISLILPLILGIYRIGCILNGCCYGLETNSKLGMYLPDSGGYWAYRYPTQPWLMVFDLGLFALLWKWRLKNPPPGWITYAFLLSFSAFRLLVDSFRDLPAVYGNFSLYQLSSLAILIVTITFIFESKLESKKEMSHA